MFITSEKINKDTQRQSVLNTSLPIIVITFLTIILKIAKYSFEGMSAEPLIIMLENSALPLISSMIAYSLGGLKALFPGLLGGIIANSGITLFTAEGVQGFSGLYGCITTGRIAGKSFMLMRKFITLRTKDKNSAESVVSVLSICITALSALGVNEISAHLNTFTLFTLSALSSWAPLLTCVLTGMAVSTNSFGAVYMGGYLFAAAAFATGQSEVLTGAFAAILIPSISIATFSYLYKSKMRKYESALALCSLLGGLFGVKYSSALFFSVKPLRLSLSCIAGGCVSSLLCTLFKCRCGVLPQSIFNLIYIEKPLFFLLSVICGVLVCVFIMSLLFDTQDNTENEKEKELKIPIESPA